MKVLIVGHGDFYGGGKTAFMMEALLATGHEVERVKLGDIQQPERTWGLLGFDDSPEYQGVLVKQMIASIREQEVIKIKRNPGPRGRWGKLK